MESKNILSAGTKSGDVGLTTGKDNVSKFILWAQDVWTQKANRSHAFAIVGDGLVVEALAKIKLTELSGYQERIVDIYRLPLSEEERKNFRLGMMNRINGAYGVLKYPLFFLDALTSWFKRRLGMKKPCFFFTRVLGISNIPVCSQLIIWGIHKFTSYRLKNAEGKEVNWRIVSPDYLEDLFLLPENKVVKIFSA